MPRRWRLAVRAICVVRVIRVPLFCMARAAVWSNASAATQRIGLLPSQAAHLRGRGVAPRVEGVGVVLRGAAGLAGGVHRRVVAHDEGPRKRVGASSRRTTTRTTSEATTSRTPTPTTTATTTTTTTITRREVPRADQRHARRARPQHSHTLCPWPRRAQRRPRPLPPLPLPPPKK